MSKNKKTLEICFTLFITLLIVGAFISALTYDFVSARAPLVILVPLLILNGFQLKKAWKEAHDVDVMGDLKQTLGLHNKEFNGIASFFGWMIFLLVLIFVTGHYVGMAVFMFFLMNLISEEELPISIIVSVVVTLVIYLLFEHLFNIELYRGLVYRIWMGYGF